MSKHTRAVSNNIDTFVEDMGTLAEHARALMVATADVAGEKVDEARKRLEATLENGKEMYGDFRDQAIKGAKVADKSVRENPYQAIGIALSVGTLLGHFLSLRCYKNGN